MNIIGRILQLLFVLQIQYYYNDKQQKSYYVSATTTTTNIVVVGSINADTFLPVIRFPKPGENIMITDDDENIIQTDVPGGKGCTQAIAVQKLLLHNNKDNNVKFVCQFGNDYVAKDILKPTLIQNGVNIEYSHTSTKFQSGRGYVFIIKSTGQVSAIVTGGSNIHGWKENNNIWNNEDENNKDNTLLLDEIFSNDCKYVMLQREIPEYVNKCIAKYCNSRQIKIIQDIGGDDRIIDNEMLSLCTYIIPNETELIRLVHSFGYNNNSKDESLIPNDDIIQMAKFLQKHGAQNVLVTQGSKGSILVCSDGETIIYQPAIPVLSVVDETGAGDCYRAAFVVAMSEGRPIQECMQFAAAAGAYSVTQNGAVPSTPNRKQVEEILHNYLLANNNNNEKTKPILKIPRGDGLFHDNNNDNKDFPFLIGSRLNSMKDRPELWDKPLLTPKDYVRRQACIKGLTCVDFNYPQHFHTWTTKEAKEALDEAGLKAGAVCLRYPTKFARGAMNHPDLELRNEAIQLTKDAAQAAIDLGCTEVVIWSAYDGYDYPFQVDYDIKWNELIDAFRECCDTYPNIKFSLEYKPTDENTRFFTIPSTGAALLFVNDVDRTNFGLTLDVGHMLMSGENPGQSIAMVGRVQKLFGIQLNDGYTRLAAEDGLMFGSIHPHMALEIMYQLHRINFNGHLYFDTFPQRTDPILEAEYNIEQVKKFWYAATLLPKDQLRHIMMNHDAIGALRLVNTALSKM